MGRGNKRTDNRGTQRKLSRVMAGFTIVELMIATAVFSFVLLVAMAIIIQVGRFYYKGLTSARTQDTARAIMDEVGQRLQFGQSGVTVGGAPGATQSYCVNGYRYTYVLNKQLESAPSGPTQSLHVLWRDPYVLAGGVCGTANLAAASPSPAGVEMMADHMRLAIFDVPSPDVTGLSRLEVAVVYGDQDLLVSPTQCSGVTYGTQFCAVSDLKTSVNKRL